MKLTVLLCRTSSEASVHGQRQFAISPLNKSKLVRGSFIKVANFHLFAWRGSPADNFPRPEYQLLMKHFQTVKTNFHNEILKP